MTTSVFAQYKPQGYPYRFHGKIHVGALAGGTPTNPAVAEGWLKTKIADKDLLIASAVAEVMAERGLKPGEEAEAIKIVEDNRHLTGFRRNSKGLYIEGRQLKACLKEATNVATNAGKLPAKGWGNPTDPSYKKGIKAWFPEHVFVEDRFLQLGVIEPSQVVQQFVHTFRGSGIQYTEIVEDVDIEFTVETDYEFSEKEWAAIWLTAERQGIGAQRSQGFGRFDVTEWEPIRTTTRRRKVASSKS